VIFGRSRIETGQLGQPLRDLLPSRDTIRVAIKGERSDLLRDIPQRVFTLRLEFLIGAGPQLPVGQHQAMSDATLAIKP
jgi:hypothetical protein